MGRRVLAIAILAVRSAIRSHLVGVLLVLLPLVIFGLPMTVKGDGTLGGYVHIVLSYSLGAIAVLLGAATLWASCLSISGEVEGKQIHLVAVKPVRGLEIWLGKWLGLLALNAVLLALAGILTYLLLLWSVGRLPASEAERRDVREEILVGRSRCVPRVEPLEADVDREIERLIAAGQLAASQPREIQESLAGRNVRMARSTVAPGQSKTWNFDLPHALASGRAESGGGVVSVRFFLSMYIGDRQPVSGTWTVGTPARPALFSYSIRRHIRGVHRFNVPVPPEAAGAREIVVTFANADRSSSSTALFRSDLNLEALVRETSFESNLLRALLLIFCGLGLLAALGLAAGTFVSFPIAAFSVCSLLLIAALAHYFDFGDLPGPAEAHAGHSHGTEEAGPLTILGGHVARVIEYAVAPVMEFDALEPLSDGILISWQTVAKAAGLLLGIYSGILAWLGSWILGRRELAL